MWLCFFFHISTQLALMGGTYVVCQTGRKIAGQGNDNANVNNCGWTSTNGVMFEMFDIFQCGCVMLGVEWLPR